MARVEARVLGPLELLVDGRPVTPTAARQLALLASLLVEPERVVAPEALIEDVWGSPAPDNALSQLQNHIHLLRKRLAASVGSEEAKELLRRSPAGYRLHAPAADLAEFTELLEAARAAPGPEAVLALAGRALSLHRGPAYAGAPLHSTRLAGTAQLIEERRLEALELRIDAELRIGRHARALPELRLLVRAHPQNERFQRLLAAALSGAGREGEAAGVLRRLAAGPATDGPQVLDRTSAAEAVAPAAEPVLDAPPVAGVPSGRTRRPGRPSEASPRLRFTLLGPVRAWRGEERLSIGSPQQRALLATLLLRGGRTVLAGELVDALWGDEPPHAALAALRTYASRLRNVLGPDGNALVSESGGYAIRVGHGCLDIDKAEHLATEAEKSRAAGDRTRARELINEALGVWDGEPLAGLPGPYAETQRARLEEWRLTLIETRLDLDLEVGAHAEAVSELTALTAAHPLREWLRKLLMLALYRSGRQAEALAVYTDTRRLLADELGIEPNPELAELQQRILRADPGLTLNSAADRSSPDPGFTRPTQLPAMVPDFTGRESFVAELIEQLVTAEGRIMAVSAVAGMGGAGKTTLAVHVAHAARHHFPDGQLYADLQGTGPVPAEPEAVLGSFLRALGVPDSAIPDGLQERTALFRSTLDGRRVLALLDNARDAAQLRPLLPIAEGCAALITSRRRMLDLAGARLVDLGVLSADEALALFTRIVGQERVGAGRDAAMDVVAACGFLPLAIRIAASRLAARRTWTVSVLAHKLADERRRLDELRAGDLAVKATFELGYGQLEPAQARAFRLLALPAGPDIGLEAAAALLDREAGTTEDLLESLVDLSLMETPGPGRYRCHDLLRTYARHRSPAGAEEDEALLRLHRFHLASARAAFVVTRPGDRSLAYLRDTGSPGLEFATHDAALDWVCGEAGNLLAAVQQAVAHPSDEALGDAVDTLWAVGDLLESGKWEEAYSRAAGALVAAAGQRGAVVAEGRARCLLGRLAAVAGRFEEAGTEALRAGSSARETGDRLVLVQALILRSTVARHRHAYEEAERCLEAALEEYRADGDRYGEAAVLADLARTHAETGAGERAVEEARRSVRAFRELGAVSRLGDSLYTLGLALERLGQRDDAFVALDEARTLFIRARQGLCEGMALFRMAENCLGRGQPSRAAQFAQRALTALETVGGDRRRASVLTLLGRAFHDLNRLDEARSCWTTALGLFEPLGASEAATVRTLLGEAPMARRA